MSHFWKPSASANFIIDLDKVVHVQAEDPAPDNSHKYCVTITLDGDRMFRKILESKLERDDLFLKLSDAADTKIST